MTRRERALKVILNRALKELPPLRPTPTASAEEIAATAQGIEDAFMWGRHHCGTIQRGRTRTGVFGEAVTETYCPACDGV